MCAGTGLHQLQSRADRVSGGISRAAQKRVSRAHFHQHSSEIIALGQCGAAVLGRHLALAQLYHFGNHLIHSCICSRINDLQTVNVKAALCGVGLDLVHIADQDRCQETFRLQLCSRFENTCVRAFRKHDLAGICLEDLNQFVKHLNYLRFYHLQTMYGRFFTRIF